jgi:hypothetical protein
VDQVTVNGHRRNEPTRWVRLTLAVRDRPAGEPFITHGATYTCAIEPGDPAARRNDASVWESGILSGAGYAWRRWMSEGQGLLVKDLTGRLAADDVEGIAAATLLATATLCGRDYPPDAHCDWQLVIAADSANGAPGGPSSEPVIGPAVNPQ